MTPITEEQEWTLRRWASTVGKRPRKRDKAFLMAEKGLSEEQIDSWWKNVDAPPAPSSKSILNSPILLENQLTRESRRGWILSSTIGAAECVRTSTPGTTRYPNGA